MTHACLVVVASGRRLTLHTRHSGSDVPRLLPRALDLVAVRYGKMIVRSLLRDRDEQIEHLERLGVFESLEYASSTAAMSSAAQPFLLEPVMPAMRKELPAWSGLKAPYVLRVARERWKLYGEDGGLLSDLDYKQEVLKRMEIQ